MARGGGLFRRGSTYYYRTRTPKRLRARLGRAELTRSLGTADDLLARKRLHLLSSLTLRLWDAVAAAMTQEEVQSLVQGWLKAKLDEDMAIRQLSRTPSGAFGVMVRTPPWLPDRLMSTVSQEELFRRAAAGALPDEGLQDGEFLTSNPSDYSLARQAQLKPLEHATTLLDLGDRGIATPTVAAILAEAGVVLADDDPSFSTAVDLMMRAQRDLLVAIGRRDEAGWFWRPSDPQVDPAASLLNGRTKASEARTVMPSTSSSPIAPVLKIDRLSTAKLEFLRQQGGAGQSALRMEEQARAIDKFGQWLGVDMSLSEVTPRHAGDFLQALTTTPMNGSKRLPYREMPFASWAEEAIRLGETRLLSTTTIRGKYLDPLRTFFAWAGRTGKLTANPFEGIKPETLRGAKVSRQREDFTSEQLSALFRQPLFRGSRRLSRHGLYEPGSLKVDDARFWLPVMALLSGARLNELCGLELRDFDHQDGVAFFSINNDAEHKSVKTAASVRFVPLHHELIRIGLLRRVERLGSEGQSRLFPELKPGPKGYLSEAPSKFFARLIKRSVGTDDAVVFHSFRHTFITRLRSARVPEDMRKKIVGHEAGDTHGGYGRTEIPLLNDYVQSVSYPDLDLSGLSRGSIT